MDTFIARQPIFDDNRRVFGYELLCRSGPENVFGGIAPDAATNKVIADSSFVFGLDGLTRGRLAFINLTRDALLRDIVALLPASRTVAEILETVKPDDAVVAAWYARKVARDGGQAKTKAVIAIMRKLARALWHVSQGHPFDATKLY
ncbi:MAG: hypothetical protein GY704_07530, partial [Phycisphaeraceae bacterium]|nr:hypothetical protein [Phycisphaeraceae bacterium]